VSEWMLISVKDGEFVLGCIRTINLNKKKKKKNQTCFSRGLVRVEFLLGLK
jgi:hypothetical protein